MKRQILLRLCVLMLIVLSGCGRQNDTAVLPETEETIPWKENGFLVTGELTSEPGLWPDRYTLWTHTAQNAANERLLDNIAAGTCGSLFWNLATDPESGKEFFLELYDTTSGECERKRFTFADLGLEDSGNVLLDGMDLIDREHYVFAYAKYEQDGGRYVRTEGKFIYSELAGSNTQVVDDPGFALEKENAFFRCDGQGRICVINLPESDREGYRVCMLDRNGTLLLEREFSAGQKLSEPLRTPEGDLIIPVYSDETGNYEFLLADADQRQLRSIGNMEASYNDAIWRMFAMQGNDIYYETRDIYTGAFGIVKWNIKSGSRTLVFDTINAGWNTFSLRLAFTVEQKPVLWLRKSDDGSGKEWIVTLEDHMPEDQNVIRVANFINDEKMIRECVTLAPLENPQFRYVYEDILESEAKDRAFIEITQGKGPDILFLSKEDMYRLAEKGALLDMKDLIPEDMQEELLPAVLEIGAVDGKILGVPKDVYAESLMVSKDVWQSDGWRLEDVIRLMEEKKLTGALCSPTNAGRYYASPFVTVKYLVEYSLNDSFLIDWENGKSHFDDERFVRLLELTREDLTRESKDTRVWLDGGKSIVWKSFDTVSALTAYVEHMEEEGGRNVGFPSDGIGGCYMREASGMLVVNARIADSAAAENFLEILMGDALQDKYSGVNISIRKLCPEDYYTRDAESGALLTTGIREPVKIVTEYEDGTTPYHRAGALLEACRPWTADYSEIMDIVCEELNAMYETGKSAQTTAQTINHRVQLYLDEK